MPRFDRAVVAFANGTTDVSTMTPLTGWTSLKSFDALLFVLTNHSPTDEAFLLIETSEDGTRADDDARWIARAGPGKQASVEIAPNARGYYRLSGYSQEPSFPVVPVKFSVIGRRIL